MGNAYTMPEKRAIWPMIKPYLTIFDGALTLIVVLIYCVSMVTMYSAGVGFPGRFEDHLRNILLSFFVMWIAACRLRM